MNTQDLPQSDNDYNIIKAEYNKSRWDKMSKNQIQTSSFIERIFLKGKLTAWGNAAGILHTGCSRTMTITQKALLYSCLDSVNWLNTIPMQNTF